jgi:uncharacterized protein (DUF433 family)
MRDHETLAHGPLDLVDADPEVVHGQARIRGTRIPVSVVFDCLAAGMSDGQIHVQYTSLPNGAVAAALAYAAVLARRSFTLSSRRPDEAEARR